MTNGQKFKTTELPTLYFSFPAFNLCLWGFIYVPQINLQIPLHAHLIYLTVFNSISLTGMEEKYEPLSSQQRVILNFLL